VEKRRRWTSDFFGVTDSDGCREGSSEWDGEVDALGDAFGC
jgi:hypothetical protein